MSSSWIKLHLRPASSSPHRPPVCFLLVTQLLCLSYSAYFSTSATTSWSPKKTLSPVKCGVTSDKPDSEGPPLSGGRVGENAGHNRQSSLREPGWRQRRNRRAGRSNATLLFWLSPHHTGLCAGVRHTPAS